MTLVITPILGRKSILNLRISFILVLALQHLSLVSSHAACAHISSNLASPTNAKIDVDSSIEKNNAHFTLDKLAKTFERFFEGFPSRFRVFSMSPENHMHFCVPPIFNLFVHNLQNWRNVRFVHFVSVFYHNVFRFFSHFCSYSGDIS